LKIDAGSVEVANHLSAILTAELAESARDSLATITDPAGRCALQQEILHTLVRVRRQDYLAGRLVIERERQARERVNEKILDDISKESAPWRRSFRRSFMADMYAQPDFTSQAMANGYAESLLRDTKLDLSGQTSSVAPDQAQSN
jgi:hypothetical protein